MWPCHFRLDLQRELAIFHVMYHRRCSPAPFSGRFCGSVCITRLFSGCFVHPHDIFASLHYLLAEMHGFGATIATRIFAIYITLLFSSGCFVHPHDILAEMHAQKHSIATRHFTIYFTRRHFQAVFVHPVCDFPFLG